MCIHQNGKKKKGKRRACKLCFYHMYVYIYTSITAFKQYIQHYLPCSLRAHFHFTYSYTCQHTECLMILKKLEEIKCEA